MMREKFLVFCTAILFIFGDLSAADERPILAVFDLDARGLNFDRDTLDRLTDYLVTLMTRQGYQVVPRSQIRERLQEAKKGSYRACYDESCQIELGKEMAAQKTLAGQVLRLGKKCKVMLTLYDLKKAASEKAGTASGECDEDDVVARLEQAVRDLLGGSSTAGTMVPSQPGTTKTGYLQMAQKESDNQKHRLLELEQAWGEIKQLASNDTISYPARATAVEKFLKDFPRDNPHEMEARTLLARLRAGPEGEIGLEWVYSRPAGVEFTKSEITVAQFSACVRAGVCRPCIKATSTSNPDKDCNFGYPDRGQHPMNCVDVENAVAFCGWVGGRLPSEEEWQKEFTRDGTTKYPWGDNGASCENAVVLDFTMKGASTENGCGIGTTWPVCSKTAGKSASGLCDMVGNLWEWTATAEKGRNAFVMRGGSWLTNDPDGWLSTARQALHPEHCADDIGFRCVRAAR